LGDVAGEGPALARARRARHQTGSHSGLAVILPDFFTRLVFFCDLADVICFRRSCTCPPNALPRRLGRRWCGRRREVDAVPFMWVVLAGSVPFFNSDRKPEGPFIPSALARR